MSRLRVAYLPATLNPGGAERQMLALAERLPRDRFDVEFVTLSGPGSYDQRVQDAGLKIRHAGAAPAPGASLPARVWHRAAKASRYVSVIRSGRYDIVDAWLYPADVLAALLRPITRTPVVVTGQRNVDPQGYFGPLERPIAWAVSRLTDGVVANSTAAAKHAIQVGRHDPGKVRVIRNGVVVRPPASAAERASGRRELGVTAADQIVVGCVANLLPVKRHDLLIQAFAPLVHEGLPVRLDLVGEGPLRPALERQVRDLGLEHRVRFHGSIQKPETLYNAFDLVAQASEREGLPNALLEAGAAGCPIVATAAGGSGEIVRDGETGLLVDVGDREGLGAALRRLVIDPDLRGQLGRGARAHTIQSFGMERFVAEFAALYESIYGGKRSMTAEPRRLT